MSNFKKILQFQKLLQKFNKVKRDLASIHDIKVSDNDVEHSYRVAMLCWMLIEECNLDLQVSLVLKYTLIHDFVEVYAGDTSIYKDQGNKVEREHNALLKLRRKFPHLKSMWQIVEEYEERKNPEAKFVYVIEKLEPILTVLLSEKDHWITRKISLESLIEKKLAKIGKIDSSAQVFAKEVFDYLRRHKKKYFR